MRGFTIMKSAKETIFIAGAGRMGRGIAVAFAFQGHQVTLIDIKERNQEEFEELTSAVLAEINSHLKILAASDLVSNEMVPHICQRIRVQHMDNQPEIWNEANIIFEAVPEVAQ